MRFKIFAGILAFLIFFASGCTAGSAESNVKPADAQEQQTAISEGQENLPQASAAVSADYSAQAKGIAMPVQTLENAVSEEGYTIDLSNASQGYVTVSSESVPVKKIKVQIMKGEEKYNYDFTGGGDFSTYPLQMGDGAYRIVVYENIEGDKYAEVMAADVDVKLESEYVPYLVPNQIINYSQDTKAVLESFALCNGAQSDLLRVSNVYGFIVDNIVYDQPKADNLQSGYLPNVDDTLATKKGICYDYSALLACMLRVEKIPTRLVMGYVSGVDVYHAWNEIYIADVGWVRTAIYFDGKNWQIADSTFGAANAAKITGDDAVYTRVKVY